MFFFTKLMRTLIKKKLTNKLIWFSVMYILNLCWLVTFIFMITIKKYLFVLLCHFLIWEKGIFFQEYNLFKNIIIKTLLFYRIFIRDNYTRKNSNILKIHSLLFRFHYIKLKVSCRECYDIKFKAVIF